MTHPWEWVSMVEQSYFASPDVLIRLHCGENNMLCEQTQLELEHYNIEADKWVLSLIG